MGKAGIPRAGQPTSPAEGNSRQKPSPALALSSAWVDTWHVLFEPSHETAAPIGNPPKRLLMMAILAPFGVIALLASPLLIDAFRHVGGFFN